MQTRTIPDITETSILFETQECRLLLHHCTDQAQPSEARWCQNRLNDFNLWDTGVGASAKRTQSLDVRLRDDRSTKRFVIASLGTLRTWLDIYRRLLTREEADDENNIKPALPGGDLDLNEPISLLEAKDGIQQLFGILVKLGVAIRQAGTVSRVSNADKTFTTHKTSYKEFEAELMFSLQLMRYRHIRTKNLDSGQLQIPYTGEQVCSERSELQKEWDIIVNANAKRRHRFAFARKRAEKLQLNKSSPEATDQVHLYPTTGPNPAVTREKLTPPQASQNTETPSVHTTDTGLTSLSALRPEQSMDSTNQLSTHKPQSLPSATHEDDRPTAPPTVITLKVTYPKGPNVSAGSGTAVCPYCLFTISHETTQALRWKLVDDCNDVYRHTYKHRKHVADDLQPYTCHLSHCPQENPLLKTSQEWKTHLSTQHRGPPKWTCFLCERADHFISKESLKQHVSFYHGTDILDSLVDDFVAECQIEEGPVIDRCPICYVDTKTWSIRRAQDYLHEPADHTFIDHVAYCMHMFSLRALPPIDDRDNVHESGSKTPTVDMDNDSRLSISVDPFTDTEAAELDSELTKADFEDLALRVHTEKADHWEKRVLIWQQANTNADYPTIGYRDLFENSLAMDELEQTLGIRPSSDETDAVAVPLQGVDYDNVKRILLEQSKKSWSKIPRVFSILMFIGHLEDIDVFVKTGVSDYWFPFSKETLSALMPVAHVSAFLATQHLVFHTHFISLVQSSPRHCHFGSPDKIPLESVREATLTAWKRGEHVRSTTDGRSLFLKLAIRGRTFQGLKETQASFESEMAILKKVVTKHRHLPELFNSYTDVEYNAIALMPIADCDLRAYLERNLDSKQRLSLRTLFGCLASVLAFLHDNNIWHRDIQPANIRFDGGDIVLEGFEHAFDQSSPGSESQSGPITNSLRYVAPEVADQEAEQASPTDVWSLGCTFLEIWTVLHHESLQALEQHLELSGEGHVAYEACELGTVSWIEHIKSLSNANLEPADWIQGMLVRDPKDRWSAHTILENINQCGQDFIGNCCTQDHKEEQHRALTTNATSRVVTDAPLTAGSSVLASQGFEKTTTPDSQGKEKTIDPLVRSPTDSDIIRAKYDRAALKTKFQEALRWIESEERKPQAQQRLERMRRIQGSLPKLSKMIAIVQLRVEVLELKASGRRKDAEQIDALATRQLDAWNSEHPEDVIEPSRVSV